MISTHEMRKLYLESTHLTGFRQHQEVVLQFYDLRHPTCFMGNKYIDAKR